MDDKRNNVVIVALPSEDDLQIHKVSSEKKPHLTLLFLGEADLGEDVVRFVEHAAKTSLTRFGLPVDRRGTLGEDEADVLFFEKGTLTERLEQFRADLRGNDNIAKAYDSVDQYPEWLPHLTLGYPENPANDEALEYPIHWVNFDRIAIWFGDSEGPEFRLESERLMEVAMSEGTITKAKLKAAEVDFSKIKVDVVTPATIDSKKVVENTLQHYGVKGMKWGVRRTAAQLANAAKSRSKKSDSTEDASEDYKTARSAASKPASSLSNTEMRQLIERMRLEQDYQRVMAS